MDHSNLDWMISVDDHVLEPPDVWQSRISAKFRDRAPKLISGSDGEWWEYDGRRVPTSGLSAEEETFGASDLSDGCIGSKGGKIIKSRTVFNSKNR